MICYIGSEDDSYLISDYAERNGGELMVIDKSGNIYDVLDELFAPQYKYIVINIPYLVNSPDEICDAVNKLNQCSTAELIFYAAGYESNMEIIRRLSGISMYNFILASHLSGQKHELEQCMNGSYRGRTDLTVSELEPEQQTVSKPKSFSFRRPVTIGVTGCLSRIGTTTQALQLLKYLQFCGKSSCYIQMNRSGYVENMMRFYADCRSNDDIGVVSYQNTDMYYRTERISDILQRGYDFYIYDYGVFDSRQLVPFLEREVKIVICGAKPDEIQCFQQIYSQLASEKVSYIFSFVPERDRADVLDIMEAKAADTYFAGYSPDPFSLVRSDYHDKIIGGFLQSDSLPTADPRQRVGIFHRKGANSHVR